MKVVYSSLEFPYGLTTVILATGYWDRRVFGVNNIWCDAHQRRCKTVLGFTKTQQAPDGTISMVPLEMLEIR